MAASSHTYPGGAGSRTTNPVIRGRFALLHWSCTVRLKTEAGVSRLFSASNRQMDIFSFHDSHVLVWCNYDACECNNFQQQSQMTITINYNKNKTSTVMVFDGGNTKKISKYHNKVSNVWLRRKNWCNDESKIWQWEGFSSAFIHQICFHHILWQFNLSICRLFHLSQKTFCNMSRFFHISTCSHCSKVLVQTGGWKLNKWKQT